MILKRREKKGNGEQSGSPKRSAPRRARDAEELLVERGPPVHRHARVRAVADEAVRVRARALRRRRPGLAVRAARAGLELELVRVPDPVWRRDRDVGQARWILGGVRNDDDGVPRAGISGRCKGRRRRGLEGARVGRQERELVPHP